MASSARIEELRKKFEENPRRYFAPLANEYRKAGEIDQAISICREHLPQQPGHMSGHIVYGQALYEARQFEEAKSVFETALTLDPENLIALRHLGDIALIIGDADGARSWYRRVLEADPRNEEIQAQLARLDEGSTTQSAPTPVAGAAEVKTAEVKTPEGSAPPAVASAAASLSSATTVVIPAMLPSSPPPKEVSRVPAETLPELQSLSSAPTAEVHVDSLPTKPEERPVVPQRLELDSSVPGTSSDDASRVGGFSLDGLETTSLSSPTGPVAARGGPALELDRPPADAFPMQSAAPLPEEPPSAPSPPLPMIDLGPPEPEQQPTPGAASPPAPAPVAASSSEPMPELLDLSQPPPATVATSAAPEAVSAPDAAVSQMSPTSEPAPPSAPPESGPFVTETMAELYLQQGHRDEALRVYRALLEQRPGDASLQAKVDALTQESAPKTPTPPTGAPGQLAGPTIREVLSVVAMRRPGERPASGQNGSMHEEPVSAPPPAAPPASAPQPTAALGGDVLGALFAGGSIADTDEAAARTLARAFAPDDGNGAGVPGSPARVAANDLTLDSVFAPGQAPAAPSSFSFDQFFSKGATAPHAPSSTSQNAESRDDVAEFTSWLHGLKHR